ncbi:MAG: Uma2 family endonuclease [Gemmatimonadota bacterium]
MTNGNIIDFKPRQPVHGAQHGFVCANIAYELKQYIADNPIGLCFGSGTGFLVSVSPPRIVALDAAFVRGERMPEGGLPLTPFAGAPDLAVIVIAPTDKFDEIEADVHDMIDAGTAHVWIMRPRVRMITVHRSRNELAILGETEALTAEDVLPGFSVPVKRVFDG